MFVGREAEIKFLETNYVKNGSQIVVVYGHKGVGKTALLNKFCENKPFSFYAARACSSREQCYQWANQLKGDNADIADYPTYGELLDKSLVKSDSKSIIIVDEFHYIIKNDPDFMRELATFVEATNKTGECLIILTTSASGWVENSMIKKLGILSAKISGLLKVRELKFIDICQAFPGYKKNDYIGIFSILGGVPGLWKCFSPQLSLRDNIIKNILYRESRLFNEIKYYLTEELREPAIYSTILASLAHGFHKLNDIYRHTEFSRAKISVYLKNLMELDLVEKVYSYETDSYRETQKGIYRINNAYVNFYFKFIYPNMSYMDIYSPEEFFNRIFVEYFDGFVEASYRKIIKESLMESSTNVGEWLGKSGNIDIIADLKDGRTIAANCCFSKQAGIEEYEWLAFSVKKAKINNATLRIYSENGFSEELRKESVNSNVELYHIFR